MAKVRVYELAKELGLESKDLLKKLNDMGEFVRSASSTIEPPVVRRLNERLTAEKTASAPAASETMARARYIREGRYTGWRRQVPVHCSPSPQQAATIRSTSPSSKQRSCRLPPVR